MSKEEIINRLNNGETVITKNQTQIIINDSEVNGTLLTKTDRIVNGCDCKASNVSYKQTFKLKDIYYPCYACQGGGCPVCSGYGIIYR